MAEEKQPSLVGQEISGCEILQKIAVGGMGSVYKARHKALDRIVCVKILSPALTNDKKAVELFLTEARAIAELEHPNIVQVFNVGREKGYYFIVMSFIEGQTLSQILKKEKQIPLGTILNLFEGVLLGLDAAHAKGIIHRDIKPSNILINAEMQPKIVDFGIAKKTDKEKGTTKTTELAGTAYFIAPEQALGRDLDTRADLYSVGASLYYVLTGQFPYNGKNTIDIIQKHINDPVPDPAKLRPEIPAWLGAAVQKLMSKKPEDRFQTAKETYVYFQKMRADDQLRLNESTINLGGDSALKIVKEEKFQTDMVQRKRQLEKPLKKSSSTNKPSLLPSVDKAAVLPNVTSPNEAPPSDQQNQGPQLLSEKDAKKVDIYTPSDSVLKQQLRERTRRTAKLIGNFILKWPAFIILTLAVAFVFHQLGVICSEFVSPTEGLLENLINPFFTHEYAPHQLLFMLLAVIAIIVTFCSSAVKEYASSTLTLLFLAIVSYMAGLFTPEISFLDPSYVFQFLFTPEYYLCYLVGAMAMAIAMCFTYNRTVLQGFLGAALVVLVVALSYLASHLTIAPASNLPTYKLLFFLALFAGVVSVYYLANRNERTSVFAPLAALLLASACMWVYTISGLVNNIQHTTQALIANIDVKTLNYAQQNAEMEQELGFNSNRSTFATLNKVSEVSIMNDEAKHKFFSGQLERISPNLFDEKNSELFIRLLSAYYHGGESKMDYLVWSYALTLPIESFNKDAQENGAYAFLMIMLMVLAIGLCTGAILLEEE